MTIFGESAGGWSVDALMVSKHADGLFHRAIAQSGSLKASTIKVKGLIYVLKYIQMVIAKNIIFKEFYKRNYLNY